jgi:hypothetical protein
MIYIHGGEFQKGSANEFPGHQLAANGQVSSQAHLSKNIFQIYSVQYMGRKRFRRAYKSFSIYS